MTKLKKLVTTAPVLAYYDPTKELTIQCDVSSTGLDSALMQEGKPLSYASRALSDTEVGYAQIEKECLAIVFSLERFHQYYFGRETVVHTDHKSLETIVKKHKAPKRIQGILLRLLQYDIEVTSRGGKEMHIADALSRAYLTDRKYQTRTVLSNQRYQVSANRTNNAEKIHEATDTDTTMQTFKETILNF